MERLVELRCSCSALCDRLPGAQRLELETGHQREVAEGGLGPLGASARGARGARGSPLGAAGRAGGAQGPSSPTGTF